MATDYVYVGCKMPNGVILNLTSYELVDKDRGLVRRSGDELRTVELKGNAVKMGVPDLNIGGYVFTRVPRDFWEEWFLTHDDNSLIKDGDILPPENTEKSSEAKGRERADEAGQFERIKEGDIRMRSLGVKKFVADDIAA